VNYARQNPEAPAARTARDAFVLLLAGHAELWARHRADPEATATEWDEHISRLGSAWVAAKHRQTFARYQEEKCSKGVPVWDRHCECAYHRDLDSYGEYEPRSNDRKPFNPRSTMTRGAHRAGLLVHDAWLKSQGRKHANK
jgi:hypothetical protein